MAMEKEPKTNTGNKNLRGGGREDVDTNDFNRNDNTGGGDMNDGRQATDNDRRPESRDAGETDTDKYLGMEQPGVQYTKDPEPTNMSDNLDYGGSGQENKWNPEGGNSEYSDAFNQDDYILEDNVDLDEDQNQSISSDDEDFEETNERYTN